MAVSVFISEQDGDVHFSTKNCNSREFEECVELFKQNYLKFDSVTKDWCYPIKISVISMIDELSEEFNIDGKNVLAECGNVPDAVLGISEIARKNIMDEYLKLKN